MITILKLLALWTLFSVAAGLWIAPLFVHEHDDLDHRTPESAFPVIGHPASENASPHHN